MKGPPMRGTHPNSPLARYGEAVVDLVKAGAPFDAVEDAIDEVAGLTSDQKAALWLFAFSLREPAEQQQDARAHLAFVQ